MRSHRSALALAIAELVLACPARAQSQPLDTAAQAAATEDSASRHAGVVVISGPQPTSLPTRIPTTIESITADEIATSINAADSEDALKYLPSLLVRKRYAGDYNHAVLSTRASGTGNSARSLVYADGVLLSNLLGNGATFAPRWGMVTPEEIERVDVLYGPFSAAYPGNAAGAVVDFVTRLPQRFEAHAKAGFTVQPYRLYGQQQDFRAWQASASLGSREGSLAWWLNLNRSDSNGQPLTFGNRILTSGEATTSGVPVTGATLDRNPANQPWWLISAATQYHTVQDHLKLKLAWELAPQLRALYTLGLWHNDSVNRSISLLSDAGGALVDNTSSGGITTPISLGGLRYTLNAGDFPQTREGLDHQMHALSLKQRSGGVFDWELAASLYDYRRDLQRAYAPTTSQPQAGRLTDGSGTGWQTLKAAATWRPQGEQGAHVIDAGLQQDSYRLRNRVDSTADWISGGANAFASSFDGNTRTLALYAQDAWAFADGWTAVPGLRLEHWQAWNGSTQTAYGGKTDQASCSAADQRCTLSHPARSRSHLSPKFALSNAIDDAWVVKASTGRAIRFPTVSELYQGGINAQGQAINNDPCLRPEASWTSELSAEWMAPHASLRATLFHEDTRDALYSQLNPATNARTVQNVQRMRTSGLELAGRGTPWIKQLQLQASLTFADSKIVENSGYISRPGDTVGRQQPRVPRWRASALATWQASEHWSASYGLRYSGAQFSTLDNSDPNGFAYQGASKYFTTDLRLTWHVQRQWKLSLGIDNLNNYQYWNFHPYPQRSYSAELQFDL